MDSDETLAMAALDSSRETCDYGHCTGNPTNSYKGDRLCDQHFQQYMAMELG